MPESVNASTMNAITMTVSLKPWPSKLLSLPYTLLALLSHSCSINVSHGPTPLFSLSFILQPSLRLRRRCSLWRLIPLRRPLVPLLRRAPRSLYHIASAGVLRLYVRSVTQVLHEIADGTSDLFVLVGGERYDGDETNSDPRPRRDALRGPVPTVMTLRSDALIPF